MDLFKQMPVVSDNPLSLLGPVRLRANVGLMSRNSKARVLVAHNNACTNSQRTFPHGPTHETDLPDTTTMRRSRSNSENTVSLKSHFDLNKSGTVISEDGIRENCTHVARRKEKVAKSEMNDNPNVCAGLNQMNKTELREVCKSNSIPLSGHETIPQGRSKRYKPNENHNDKQS